MDSRLYLFISHVYCQLSVYRRHFCLPVYLFPLHLFSMFQLMSFFRKYLIIIRIANWIMYLWPIWIFILAHAFPSCFFPTSYSFIPKIVFLKFFLFESFSDLCILRIFIYLFQSLYYMNHLLIYVKSIYSQLIYQPIHSFQSVYLCFPVYLFL